jgi:hypothetical protein
MPWESLELYGSALNFHEALSKARFSLYNAFAAAKDRPRGKNDALIV